MRQPRDNRQDRCCPASPCPTDARKVYHGEFLSQNCSAIQITTAASICAVLDLHVHGKLPKSGFVKQEEVDLHDFLSNRFGRCYASDHVKHEIRPPTVAKAS